jgi:diguanylate cyclase (GGDEF)-like protein
VANVLIANPDSGERTYLFELVGRLGSVVPVTTTDKAMIAIRSKAYDIVLVDVDMAFDPSLRSHLPLVPCVILTGKNENLLKEAGRVWPFDQFVEHVLITVDPAEIIRARRVLNTAGEYARLKSVVSELRSSKDVAENRLRKISEEIKGLGSSLTANIAQELEKRIAVELRYLRFQRLKEGIEDTIRRLYSAGDVNDLLGTLIDIKDLLQGGGISLYLIDENKRIGKFLKPLVWDDAVSEHSDINGNYAPLDAADFAAFVARTGAELSMVRPAGDSRFSARYRDQMRTPLRGLLATPLTHGGAVIGLIEVYNKLGPEGRALDFGPDDQRVLRGLSEHMALAITNLNLIQYDALTGLLRPDPFFEKAVHKLEIRSKRRLEKRAWAMVMGDVDWFKLYNDRNGHEAGNRLLRDLAGLLKSAIREDDLLCRYGGEEFLFLLYGVDSIDEAMALTERIRQQIAEHRFEKEEFQPRGDLTMSFGVTLVSPDTDLRGEPMTKELLKKIAGEADFALAEAKGKPRPGLTQTFDPSKTRNRACPFIRKDSVVPAADSAPEVPAEGAFVERRRHARYYASTYCIYRENGRHWVVPTIDLSLGGAKLSSRMELPVSEPLEMFFVLGNQAKRLDGEVVYSRKVSAESDHYYSGIKFRGLSAEDERVFEDYFQSLVSLDAPLS